MCLINRVNIAKSVGLISEKKERRINMSKKNSLLRIIDNKVTQYLFAFKAHNEMDAVVEMSDVYWGAFEIKLGANQIDNATKNLLHIKSAIKKDSKGKTLAVLCVICGLSSAAYQRPDGVYVVPITTLKTEIKNLI